MKRLMIITAVFALLLTGCSTRVNHDALVELSVQSIIEFQTRLSSLHSKNLEIVIKELAQKRGLEPRTSEYDGQILYCSDAHLEDGTAYSIAGYDRKDGAAVLITIVNSQDNTIPLKISERVRSLALERGLVLSYLKGADQIRGGYLIVDEMKNGVMLIIGEERRY